MNDDDTRLEWLEVVNERDEVVGVERRGVIHERGLMHRSAQVLVFNSKGELFLQKRSDNKDEFGGLWDSSAAGHVNPGEGYEACARRELSEELGIAGPVTLELAEELGIRGAPPLEALFRMTASRETGWEHCSVFRCRCDGPLQLQAEEVDEGKWLAAAAMDRLVDDPGAALTPAIRRIWRRVRSDYRSPS